MTLLIGSLQLGFLYSIMVLGIYISFRILNIPDLTTEGSFTFGLAVSSILTAAGHPLLGLVGALAAGALAGSVTGFLQTKSCSGRYPDNERTLFNQLICHGWCLQRDTAQQRYDFYIVPESFSVYV